jgi:Ribbon-helix-helix protein, copG family
MSQHMHPQPIAMPRPLIHELRVAAAHRDMSMSALVREALAAYGITQPEAVQAT